MKAIIKKIMGTVIGVPCMAVLGYWCYAIFFGLFASLFQWDISFLICNLKFWIPAHGFNVVRFLSWGMAVMVSGFVLVGIWKPDELVDDAQEEIYEGKTRVRIK